MARGNNDIVTYLVDTKNNIKEAVDAVGVRVDEVQQTAQVRFGELQTTFLNGQAETRSRISTAVSKAGEATAKAAEAAAEAAQATAEVVALRHQVQELRQAVEDLTGFLRKAHIPAPRHSHSAEALAHQYAPAPATAPAETADLRLGTPGTAAGEQQPNQPSHEPQSGEEPRSQDARQPHAGGAGQDAAQGDGDGAARAGEEDQPDDVRLLAERDDAEWQHREPPLFSRSGHIHHLLNAAGVSSLTLTCHRDTWEFVASLTDGHPHFRPPAQITDIGEGRVSAELSGRSVSAVLIALREAFERGSDPDAADWALSCIAYLRIANALRNLGSTGEKVTVVLDDRSTSGPAIHLPA